MDEPFPRFLHSLLDEWQNWQLIGNGTDIHWPDPDEDLSVENIVLGKPSGEGQRSFQHWLAEYQQQRPVE